MDISKYRKDFPLLNSAESPTYLDSACMTLRPQAVIDAITDYYTNYPVNIHRSIYKIGERATFSISYCFFFFFQKWTPKLKKIFFCQNRSISQHF